MSDFIDHMQRKAEGIAKLMTNTSRRPWHACIGERTNVKPWYSSLSAFKPNVDIVLIGANPAGDPGNPPEDSEVDTYQGNLKREGYNAYLDESWKGLPKGEEKFQRGVRTAFSALTLKGNEMAGDALLRNSVCFNVCPVRTKITDQIPMAVWRRSEDWCMEVLRFLNPGLIICNGLGDRSPLSTVNGPDHTVEVMHLEQFGSGCIRFGRVKGDGPLTGCRIMGIPHLSRRPGSLCELHHAVTRIAEACRLPSGGRWRTRTSDLVDVNDAL